MQRRHFGYRVVTHVRHRVDRTASKKVRYQLRVVTDIGKPSCIELASTAVCLGLRDSSPPKHNYIASC